MKEIQEKSKLIAEEDEKDASADVSSDSTESEKDEKEANPKALPANYWLIGGAAGFGLIVVALIGSVYVTRFPNRTHFSPRNMLVVSRDYGNFGHRGMTGSVGYRNANQVSGKVTNVNGTTFTVDVAGQTKTVQISSTTRFPLDLASKVNVNDRVVVWGLQDSNSVIQADRIAINPPVTTFQ